MASLPERLRISGVYNPGGNFGNRSRRSFNPEAPTKQPIPEVSTSLDSVQRAKALTPAEISDLAKNNRQSLVESMIG